jgi:hypothetical protein
MYARNAGIASWRLRDYGSMSGRRAAVDRQPEPAEVIGVEVLDDRQPEPWIAGQLGRDLPGAEHRLALDAPIAREQRLRIEIDRRE